jgi:2-polyprenyl-3-methyl-5-hydroxy-6-metoxy-1,4-benzoquinol methylase
MLITDLPTITARQKARILADRHFGNSALRNIDPEHLLNEYKSLYVDCLRPFGHARPIHTVADIGSGYGWLSLAFAFSTNCRIIAVDPDEARLEAARRIAEILGVRHRIEWRQGVLGKLPLGDNEADAAFCIEVIEHVSADPVILRDLARVTNDLLIISSPNKNFPVINHDTGLPFCHWLPDRARDFYARCLGRSHLQAGNQFWTPGQMISALQDFDRVSKFLQFHTYQDYRAAQRSSERSGAGSRAGYRYLRDAYFRFAAIWGAKSVYLLPNIASTFRRHRSLRSEVQLVPVTSVSGPHKV